MGTAPVTPRTRGALIVGVLLFLAVAVPALLGFYAGLEIGRNQRVDELEQRIEQLELDVGNLLE